MVTIAVAVKPEPQGPVRVSRRTGKPVFDPASVTLSAVSRKALACAFHLASFEPGTKVAVLTVGDAEHGEPVLREALAMGADQAILIEHAVLADSDGLGIARTIAAALAKLDACTRLVTGARTVDRYAGQVGPQVAALLGWPVVSHVREAQAGRKGLTVVRELRDGRGLKLRLEGPAVLTISERYPTQQWATGWGITSAYEKEISTWGLSDLELTAEGVGPAATVSMVQKVEQISDKERGNEVLEGSPEDAAALLHRRLASRGLIR